MEELFGVKSLHQFRNHHVQRFEIQYDHYQDCELQYRFHWVKKFKYIDEGGNLVYDYVSSYDHQKMFHPQNNFGTAGERRQVLASNNWYATATCTGGEVKELNTIGQFPDSSALTATNCGFATLLTYLCLIDDDVVGVDGIGYNVKEVHHGSWEHKFRGVIDLMDQHCRKVVHLENLSKPGMDANAFLTAAMLAEFNMFVTCFHDKGERCSTFSTEGIRQGIQDGIFPGIANCDEGESISEKFTLKFGRMWYLCKLYQANNT